MAKFLKVILIIIISLILIVGGGLFAVYKMFPAEKIKEILIKELSEKTGRQVNIENLRVNILKGIEIKGFTIKESSRYKTGYFIKDEKVVLKYNLLALLKGELFIYQILLNEPYIQIIKETKDRYNFSDILDKLNEKQVKGQKVTEKKENKKVEKTEPAGFIKNIIITSIGVKKGNFIYVDYSKKEKMHLKIQDFDFDMQNILLTSIKPISIKSFCTVLYNDYKIPVNLNANVSFDLKNKKINLKIVSFALAGIITNGEVVVENFKDLSGNIISETNTKKMFDILPAEMKKKIAEFDIGIDIKNDLKFKIINNKINFSDNLYVSNGSFIYQKKNFVDKLNGKVKISDTFDMAGNFDFLLAGQNVNLKVDGKKIDDVKNSIYTIDISSPKFAVEYLLGLFPKKEKGKKDTEKTITEKEKKEKMAKTKKELQKIKSVKAPGVYINLKADSIFYKTVNLGKTIGNVRYVNNKIYSEFSIMAYDGKINGNLTADINKETYETDLTINSIILHQLVNDSISVLLENQKDKKSLLTDMQNKVYGNFNLKAKFSGNDFLDIPHTIKGNGFFEVKDGKLTSLDTGKELAAKTGIEFLKEDIDFDIMSADFNMASGKINIKNFRIYKGKDGLDGNIKVRGEGFVTVDDEIDFKSELDFNPKIAKQVEEAMATSLGIKDVSYAYNENGWMPFDFRMYGKGKNKKYDYSQPRMLENIKRNLKKKIEEAGKRYLEEKKPEIEQKAKEIFNNLFGK